MFVCFIFALSHSNWRPRLARRPAPAARTVSESVQPKAYNYSADFRILTQLAVYVIRDSRIHRAAFNILPISTQANPDPSTEWFVDTCESEIRRQNTVGGQHSVQVPMKPGRPMQHLRTTTIQAVIHDSGTAKVGDSSRFS